MLSITTDYFTSARCPEPYLKRIADAGFTHLHWCHQWNTDFIYQDCEIDQISRWLDDYGLRVNDTHASSGREKNWRSQLEYERQAGVELVKNRIDMTSRLGGDVIIMHVPREPENESEKDAFWSPLLNSLEELEPFSLQHGVRIAIENLVPDNFPTIERLLSEFSPEFLGHCHDSGHGNITGLGLDGLDRCKDRLISLHLNDNDGKGDLHQLLFQGTVDWEPLADLIAASSYEKMVSMEVVIKNTGIDDEEEFLAQAFEDGKRFTEMIEKARGGC